MAARTATGAAAAHLGAARSAYYCGGKRVQLHFLLSQDVEGASRRSGGTRGGRGRRVFTTEAKIWTNDGRQKAAEMMGLTMEVSATPAPPRPDTRFSTLTVFRRPTRRTRHFYFSFLLRSPR